MTPEDALALESALAQADADAKHINLVQINQILADLSAEKEATE